MAKQDNQDNPTIMVVGAGISGIGAVKLLNKIGANVILFDNSKNLTAEEIRSKLDGCPAQIMVGVLSKQVLLKIDCMVISPGVPVDGPLVTQAKAMRIPVWGEIELAFLHDKGTLLAITGTNGKTTTTALVGKIVEAWNPKTFVVGNIGNPYTEAVSQTTEDSYSVAEVSSFQLETIHKFRPHVSAILNITPDHMNRHHTMDCYIEVKERISCNQTENDVCVLNYDDPVLRTFGAQCPAQVYWFSRKEKPEKGVFLDGDMIKYIDKTTEQALLDVHDMNLIGVHNYENVMAAIAITKAAGVPQECIISEVKRFQAVEHRIEYVATKNDVMYYNDSKGTNPEASIKAIEAMSRPTVLIGGGYDKGVRFDSYIKALEGKVKLLVLMGQTKDIIAQEAAKQGFDHILYADSMEEAVNLCAAHAQPGDAVLLSPACASWGMFDNYEHRGRMFKDCVHAL